LSFKLYNNILSFMLTLFCYIISTHVFLNRPIWVFTQYGLLRSIELFYSVNYNLSFELFRQSIISRTIKDCIYTYNRTTEFTFIDLFIASFKFATHVFLVDVFQYCNHMSFFFSNVFDVFLKNEYCSIKWILFLRIIFEM